MKKLFLVFLVVSFCGLFAQGVDWNLTGAGSRAMGMGGAFIGVADDATAITWNPAGLYSLERMEASVVSQYYSEDQTLELMGQSIEQGNDTFVLNFASFAYPVEMNGMKITAAIAMQRQLEIFAYNDYGSNNWDSTEGAATTINIGAGTRFMNIFAAGLCANLWTGSYLFEEELNGNYYEADGQFSGFNLGIGGMVDLNYMDNPIPLKAGISMKTPFILKVDEEEGTSEIEMPLMLGFGFSYRLGEFLTIAADLETRGYKDKEISYDDDEDPSSSYTAVISLDDLSQFRLGAEYLLVSDFAVIPLRAGIQNVPTTNYTPDEDQIIGGAVTFGTGLIFNRFAIDVFAYFAAFEADMGFADYTAERLRTGISGIFYF